MKQGRKKIKVICSSTNEKELKDVIPALISIHQKNTKRDIQ